MKRALIIGGCRGIGRAVSARLARDGFDIVATCRKTGQASSDTAALVESAGRSFRAVELDVTDPVGSRAALLPFTADEVLPDVVVYNAGIAKDNLFVFMSREDWSDVMSTNLDGFYNTIQPFVFGMVGRKSGSIVVVGSASGQAGQAGQVNYSASKAALTGAVKALAREVGRKGVRVNVVAPGVIDTEMTKDLPVDRVLPMIPMHRTGTAEEVASAVSFLAGPESSYVTGQVLAVNGGLII